MKEESEIYLIDDKGKRFSSDTISSHIGLAQIILEQDEQLKEEFERSGDTNLLVFLMQHKGYITVSRVGEYYRQVIYNSQKLSKQQRDWLVYYNENQYELTDIFLKKNEKERE